MQNNVNWLDAASFECVINLESRVFQICQSIASSHNYMSSEINKNFLSSPTQKRLSSSSLAADGSGGNSLSFSDIKSDNFGRARLFYFYKITLCLFTSFIEISWQFLCLESWCRWEDFFLFSCVVRRMCLRRFLIFTSKDSVAIASERSELRFDSVELKPRRQTEMLIKYFPGRWSLHIRSQNAQTTATLSWWCLFLGSCFQ